MSRGQWLRVLVVLVVLVMLVVLAVLAGAGGGWLGMGWRRWPGAGAHERK